MIWKVLFFCLVLSHLSWGQKECADIPEPELSRENKCVGGGDGGVEACSSISDDLDEQLERVKEDMQQKVRESPEYMAFMKTAETQWCNVSDSQIGDGFMTLKGKRSCLVKRFRQPQWTWNCAGRPIWIVQLPPWWTQPILRLECANSLKPCCGECSKCIPQYRSVMVLAVIFYPNAAPTLGLTWICKVPNGCSCYQWPCKCQW